MRVKKVLKIRRYKAGYEVRDEVIDGKRYGSPDVVMKSAYTSKGDYIGDSKTAHRLCKKYGIAPELNNSTSKVCSIGFSEKSQKWYGWSHRAMFGFKIGDVIRHDIESSRGESIPAGFKIRTFDDAKRCAREFANSVS